VADLSPGVPNALRPLIRRIVSPTGTNTYLVGIDEIAVIDPCSADPDHIDAIVGCGGDRIRWVLVTSTVRGHAEGAAAVAARTGAQVLGFATTDGFVPDVEIGEGYEVEATEFRILALHTPGVAPDHLCYLLEDDRILVSGDLVRGDDDSDGDPLPIEPGSIGLRPENDRTAGWLTAIERLSKLRPPLRGIAPGEGHFIDDAKAAFALGKLRFPRAS
jgi:glyoxylase-like metal-dependent hydrolase (beta-lactamase superfamily II)